MLLWFLLMIFLRVGGEPVLRCNNDVTEDVPTTDAELGIEILWDCRIFTVFALKSPVLEDRTSSLSLLFPASITQTINSSHFTKFKSVHWMAGNLFLMFRKKRLIIIYAVNKKEFHLYNQVVAMYTVHITTAAEWVLFYFPLCYPTFQARNPHYSAQQHYYTTNSRIRQHTSI